MRDEIYCQLMRQLTDNKIRLSEDRGWELMWMAVGIMPCSSTVRKELEQFLHSRDNALAKDCLNRLNRIIKSGMVRIYPPYILEVEAIRFKNTQITHKVYFPDSTDAAFEVHNYFLKIYFLFIHFSLPMFRFIRPHGAWTCATKYRKSYNFIVVQVLASIFK